MVGIQWQQTEHKNQTIKNGSGWILGIGKSIVINTLVTGIRQMLQDNDSVHVIAPTGAAAFNVDGQTIHCLFRINVTNPDKPMGDMAKNN